MGILTKEAQVKLNPNNIKHYRNLGYDGKFGQIITVPIEHLSYGSHIEVEILCDYCKKEVMRRPYREYIKALKSLNKFACTNCNGKKKIESNMIKHGVSSTAKLKETKEKYKENCYKKYGVENISLVPEVQEKRKQSFVEKFGVDNPFRSPEIQEKIKATCFLNFGVEYPSQSTEIKEKMTKSFYQNGTTPTSKQQRYIFNLYKSVNLKTELNYPISYYSADICFPEEKIELEYDGGFHDGMVQTGRMTQEEFDRKEIIRDRVIKSEGYKLIRIKSNSDKLPSDSILLQMLSNARNYFSEHPNHSWIEFNLDTSLVRNAENKQGVPYDFGTLRRIKDEDLQQQTTKKGA